MNPSRHFSKMVRLSLAPGFSRVYRNCPMPEPFQRLLAEFEKPLKRSGSRPCFYTRPKPGANERTFE